MTNSVHLRNHLNDYCEQSSNEFAVITFKCSTLLDLCTYKTIKTTIFNDLTLHRTIKSINNTYKHYSHEINRSRKKTHNQLFVAYHRNFNEKFPHIHALLEITSNSSIRYVKDFFNKNWEMYLKRSLKIDKSRLLSTDVYVNKCSDEKKYFSYCTRQENDKYLCNADDRILTETLSKTQDYF